MGVMLELLAKIARPEVVEIDYSYVRVLQNTVTKIETAKLGFLSGLTKIRMRSFTNKKGTTYWLSGKNGRVLNFAVNNRGRMFERRKDILNRKARAAVRGAGPLHPNATDDIGISHYFKVDWNQKKRRSWFSWL